MPSIYVDNKGALPERRKNDHYPTEPTLIRAALARYKPECASTILDAGAGDGRWGLIAKEYFPDAYLMGLELNPDFVPAKKGFNAWFIGDYLHLTTPLPPFDLIVSNPPFAIAEEFVRRSIKRLSDNGTMIFLLPLDFQVSITRYEDLWGKLSPTLVAPCVRRPSFINSAKNRTGGSNYALYIWEKINGVLQNNSHSWPCELFVHDRREKGMDEEFIQITYTAVELEKTDA